MTNTEKISAAAFKRGYRAFQKYESRDAMYKVASFLVEHFWGKPKDMADAMGVLLLTWNQAFYRYGRFRFELLEESLQTNMSTLKKLRSRDIRSLAAADEEIIKRLFRTFLKALRNKKGKSPVAVAKALHLIAPGFFPLWDEKIARAYGCYYNPKPESKYLAFSYKMRELAQQLQGHVPPGSERTLLKLIDEYNYAKYTQDWI